MTHKLIALLPLKLHSARVPGKNFRSLMRRPLVRWMTDTLLALPEVELVVINTDARERLREVGVVDAERVLIRDRRAELCGDEVSMNRIIADDVGAIESKCYLMTHTTNPFLSATTIRRAIREFDAKSKDEGRDSLFTVNRHQSRFYREDGSPINHDPGKLVPTQDLEPWFEENSNLYIFTRDGFRIAGARIGKNAIMFITPPLESLDIDTEEDWAVAEAVSRMLAKGADL